VKAAAAAMIDQALSRPEIERPAELESPPPAAEAEAPAPFGPVVIFKDLGLTFTAKPGQTLCEVAEDNGIEIVAECHAGVCGSDPICILSGHENLNEMDDDERDALEDICGVEPGAHRLACMARITGPVEVNIVEE
jgi:ferredoxin